MAAGNIIVTGFGPFGEHRINASWECVKQLPQEIDGYNVIKEEIPVSYDTIDKKIQALWKEFNPELVVHVGVSSIANKITLETCAYKEGYNRRDVHGNYPKNGTQCSADCCENCIQVGVNVNDISNHLNATKSVKACVSVDAGRYLCEYVLFTSLSVDKDKAMFIHVPPLGKPYTEQELADGVLEVIRCALRQRKQK
ncbi:pyroglutamyl-peptidase 1 [Zophobas morio]|uniref:pyroglutamyl-peptidase 1 n=1 Tax=Zophobas morio TaxID=2755281 RepID=UPI0030830227